MWRTVVNVWGGGDSVSVKGQTVVYKEMVSVVRWPTGQDWTVGGQEVMV